ncbi:MAG TPA: hypothetical protein VNU01_04525 [Egibacteraceae bacterium]|nr:hypothetical protein [Egibacteraceae bacterium]
MPKVEISNAVRADHEEVRTILLDAFAGAPLGVEIHVKARRPRVTWRAICNALDCYPPNWSGAGANYHWFTTRKDLERVATRERHGPVERVVSPAGFSGRAYSGVPRIANVAPGTAYLVTLHMPSDTAHAGPYPALRKYPGLKTAPPIPVGCWREELFAVAAHEAFHIQQFATGARVSEIDAEKAALAALAAWREPPISAVGSRDPVPLRLF